MSLRVHVAGNAVLDVLVRGARLEGGEAEDRWGANVQLLGEPVQAALGGCGAAPAWLLGRLGARVRLNTNLGGDAWGRVVAGWLGEAGVEVLSPGAAATALHCIALSAEGKRRSLYYAGDKVAWERSLEDGEAEWFLASGYGRVGAEDAQALGRVCASLRGRGTKVAFDPSPWFAGRADVATMRALWAEVDCLVGTEEELAHWEPASGPAELAGRLLERGPEQVVLKRGGEGAYFACHSGERGAVPAERVAGGNSVGAGDTFNGRLVFGLGCGEDMRRAVEEAVRLATGVVRAGRGVLGVPL